MKGWGGSRKSPTVLQMYTRKYKIYSNCSSQTVQTIPFRKAPGMDVDEDEIGGGLAGDGFGEE